MVDVPKMKYNLLGNSGLAVSSISIGNWVTAHNEQAEETAFQCFDKAIRSGVNFLDTAEAYGAGVAETVLGRILKRGEYERDQIVVSTKYMRCGPGPNAKNLSRKHLVQGLRNSMKRLQLDFVDIIFLHRFDHETPLRESINTVSTFIDQGKIDYWGTSQFTPFELSEIYKICDKFGYPYPNAEQSIYHMLRRDRIEVDLVPFYEKGLGTTTWSPLAGGLLTGKYNDGNVPEGSRFDTTNLGQTVRDLYFPDVSQADLSQKLTQLGQLATELQCTQAQLALAWVLKSDDVSTAITGASRVEQVEANLGALDVVERLSPDVLRRIEDILQNKPYLPYNFRQDPNNPQLGMLGASSRR